MTSEESPTPPANGTATSSNRTTATGRAPLVLHVAVGSKNPVKINSVKAALLQVIHNQPVFADDDTEDKHVKLRVEGFDVPSGVADQPMGDEETMTGADNRARAAYEAYRKQFQIIPHLAVGLEGGLEWNHGETVLP